MASKLDPAGTGDWTLELRRPAAHGSAASARPAGKVERKCTVGAFFHESGECAEDAYGAWVKEALAELEGKQEGGKEGKGGKENKKKK